MRPVLKRTLVLVMVFAMVFSASIAVSSAATKSKAIDLNKKTTNVSMNAGDKLKLTIKDNKKTVKVSKVKFKSSKTAVAAVSKKGVVKAKKVGKATITIKANNKTAKLKVKVSTMTPPGPQGQRITLPFMSTWDSSAKSSVTTRWNVKDLDYTLPNDSPNLNLTVAALLLATNIETTETGANQWDKVYYSLDQLGFTEHKVHKYFDEGLGTQQINYPAMVFATHREKVNGKNVVAVVFRGSSSLQDFITDVKSQLDKYIYAHSSDQVVGGFDQVGKNAAAELEQYLDDRGFTSKDTTLFITGHSLGAACAALVGLNSANRLADKNSIFCYSFATPNYFKDGKTGKDMKMFSFDNEEDIVPDVPLGLSYYKTLKRINFDREWIEMEEPDQYRLFNHLYSYFRGRTYEMDVDRYMPREYSFKFFSDLDINANREIVRNHMPYTYMALILSELPRDVALSYIGQ